MGRASLCSGVPGRIVDPSFGPTCSARFPLLCKQPVPHRPAFGGRPRFVPIPLARVGPLPFAGNGGFPGRAGCSRRRRVPEPGLLRAPPPVCSRMPRGAAVSRQSCRSRRGGGRPKGARVTGKAPILVRSPSFDGYSSTFRDLPGRPRSGDALTCGNVGRGPRSTRGFLKSTRITEKTCGSRRA